MILEHLQKQGLIKPPGYVVSGCQYLVQMGSVAYGVSNDNSDMDLYGFCIPPKDVVFPHLNGEILGFGRQKQRFEQFQQHHILAKDSGKEYDIVVYNIVKYFQLVMENNPNMIDSLYVPQRCVLHSTKIGNMVRENRKLFLSKKAWHTFRGYSYSQMHKMDIKQCEGLKELMDFEDRHEIPHTITWDDIIESSGKFIEGLSQLPNRVIDNYADLFEKTKKKSKRMEDVKIHGYSTKFGYHLVRLLDEVEQILTEGDVNLERNREQLKSIRRGEWTLDLLKDYFTKKESELETLYTTSTLRHSPDEEAIKNLLLNCLEEYYGNLDSCVVRASIDGKLLEDLRGLLMRYGG